MRLMMKWTLVCLAVFILTLTSHATTWLVGPTGQYASPCALFSHLADGDTVQIDANNGVPYMNEGDCNINASNLTITGINGRPIIDGTNFYIAKGAWIVNGHDIVIDNFEFRNITVGSGNAAGLRIQDSNGGGGTTPAGGNITVQHCYIHDNNEGILGANADLGNGAWFSANPFILFQYDEFANNGDGSGSTHNFYMGSGGNLTFTMQYCWSHDSYVGHTVKTRAPINNLLYNLIGDAQGNTSYVLNFPLGGSTYIVGNVVYKSQTTNGNSNTAMFLWRDVYDTNTYDPAYGTPNEDLHFINNTVVDDAANGFPSSFISVSCFNSSSDTCAPPNFGPVLSVPAVIENNVFVGSMTQVTNQPSARVSNNILLPNTPANLASLFVDAAHMNYHLAAGSPAIQAGVYPPTNNVGASDSAALATYEYVNPLGRVARPTPTGSTMDAGAYRYPRVDTPPSPSLSYTPSVTAPGTGTITISGLPTPPSGQFNNAVFISGNTAAVPTPRSAESSTGTITASFSVNPAVTTSTVVPIDIYVSGAHLVANVTVNPGPPVLDSVTLDFQYGPYSTVHLQGPAPAGGTVIGLSTSDASILYVPSSVTIPAGQISAETGSNTGSLWGASPFDKVATLTATQGSIVKTVAIDVIDPGIHGSGWNQSSVVAGQTASYHVTMRGFFPNSGGTFTFTSDNPAIIPTQTINEPSGNFNGDVNIVTNSSSATTVVNVTLTLNGSNCTDNSGCPDTLPITVTPGSGTTATTTSLSSSLNPSTSGSNVTFTATVAPSAATGTVTFYNGGTSIGTGTLSGGVATLTTSSLPVGTDSITATYGGNSSYATSTSNTVSQVVNSGGVTITSVTADGYQNASVNLSAAAPAGGIVVTLSSSNTAVEWVPASVSIPAGATTAMMGNELGSTWGQSPATQNATLTATYGGSSKQLTQAWHTTDIHSFGCNTANCTVTAGTPVNFQLNTAWGNIPVNASISVSSSNTASIANQTIPLATGTSQEAFNVATLSSSPTATVNLTFTYNGVVTGPYAVTVNGTTVSTTTTLTSSLNPSTYKASVKFTATVTPSAATGTVTFKDGTTTLGTGTLSGGVATYTTTSLAVGTHSITAVYGGATGYTGSTSSAVSQVVNKATTTLVLTSSLNPSTTGASVKFTATITPSAATGTVTFKDGATTLGTGTLASGVATYTTTALAVGTHSITASYATTTNYAASTSNTVSQVVSGVCGTLSSVTQDYLYDVKTSVNFTAATTCAAVVTLTSSNTAAVYVPASVTVPSGVTTAEIGSYLGSLWGQSPSSKNSTITASYNSVPKTLVVTANAPSLITVQGNATFKGGTNPFILGETNFASAPLAGGPIAAVSSNTAVIPNQTLTIAAGQNNCGSGCYLTVNTVSTSTNVTVTYTYNGSQQVATYTVTP